MLQLMVLWTIKTLIYDYHLTLSVFDVSTYLFHRLLELFHLLKQSSIVHFMINLIFKIL